MPTRELLSAAQRTQFLGVPTEMSEQMLARYYTLSDDDRSLIKQHRRNHLGFAVQLGYLRFPGRTWAANGEVSPLVVSYMANQLKVNPMSIVQYGQDREATRYEHLAELETVCGFRPFTKREYGSWPSGSYLPLARRMQEPFWFPPSLRKLRKCDPARLPFRPSRPLSDSLGKRVGVPNDRSIDSSQKD